MSNPPSDNDQTVVRPSSDPHATEYFGNSDGAVASAFSPGFVLAGKFRLEKQLGRGGMGEAWKALDTLAERAVVLKFVPKEIQHVKEAMDSVKDSFKKVHALQHQHICPVYDLFRDEHHGLCLVMKFIDGMPLDEYRRKLVEKNKALSFGDLVQILWGVAQGLDYAHEKRVVHRDIKPQNIMVGKTDGVQIIDFGLAEDIRTSMVRFSEVTMDIAGTRPYMAPEQWQGKYQDAATDQYALAVTAYELFSGRVPFQGSDVGILRECVLHDTPDPIPNLPDYINAALLRALSKQREDRFENCKAFVRALTAKPKKQAVPPKMDDIVAEPAETVVSMPSIDLKSEKQDETIWKPHISTEATDKPKKRRNSVPIYGVIVAVAVCLLLGLLFAFSGKGGSGSAATDKPASKPETVASGKKPEMPAPAKPPQDLSVLSDAEKKELQQKYPEFDWNGANVVVLEKLGEDALRKSFEKAAQTPENDFIVVRTTKGDHRIVLKNGSFTFNHKANEKGSVTLISLGPEKLVLDAVKASRIFHAYGDVQVNFGGIVFTNGFVTAKAYAGGAIRIENNTSAKMIHCDIVDNVCASEKPEWWGDFGGGIAVRHNSSLVLRDVLVENNRIVNLDGSDVPKPENNKNNRTDNTGGVFLYNGCSLAATNVVFRKNNGCALFAINLKELDLRNIAVIDNKALGWCGAILLKGEDENQTYKVANLFATGNSGGWEGSVLQIAGKGRYALDHLTLVGNKSDDHGGALCLGSGMNKIHASEVTLSNSIIVGNSGKRFSDFVVNFNPDTNDQKIDKLNIVNCITSEKNSGERKRFSNGQNNKIMELAEIKLGELRDFGNGLPVMPLLEDSPAIDAGIVTENTPKTDITGRPRNVGKAPDIGAFEWQ